MMLGEKEKKLAQYLFEKRGKYVTSKALAVHFSCSDRTIRTYLKQLSDYLDSVEGIELISKQGKGYQLRVTNEKNYADAIIGYTLPISSTSTDRQDYLINKLLFSQEKILLDDLEEELFISRSTLSCDLKKIRDLLKPYHLVIDSKPGLGLFIVGKEQDKRRFIMSYFFNNELLQHLKRYIKEDLLALPISLEELTLLILEECRQGDILLSDFVIQNLVIHIALALKRIEEGFEIVFLPLDKEKFSKELTVASAIVARLEKDLKHPIPQNETHYVALHLISKGTSLDKTRYQDVEVSLRQEIEVALEQLSQLMGFPLSTDRLLIEGLLAHIEVLLERLKHGVPLKNPLLKEIESYNKAILNRVTTSFTEMPSLRDFLISSDEIAYLALHVLAAIERYKEKQKLNVLVICATGYGSAQMLKHRILNEFSSSITVSGVIGYYDITDQSLEDIDLIISSIDLSTLVFSIPVLTVSIFLEDKDILAIRSLIRQMVEIGTKSQGNDKRFVREHFDDYFSSDMFLIEESGSKLEILQRLVASLNDTSNLEYEETLWDLMRQREKMSTVIFDSSIAVPHPIKAIDKHHKIGVAIVKNGIEWDETFTKVKFVFLVSPSLYENDYLPDITQLIVSLTERTDIQQKLLTCESYDAFKDIFLSLETERR